MSSRIRVCVGETEMAAGCWGLGCGHHSMSGCWGLCCGDRGVEQC